MKLIIDIPDEEYEEIVNSEDCGLHTLTRAIANGTLLPNITDKQISDQYLFVAFQIAIANYWEEKSKYLTPPCDCSSIKEK